MNKTIRGNRWKTMLTVGLAGSILLGGCASNEEAQQNVNSGFTGVTEAPSEQSAQAHPFPSNGLKDDGYGVYQQSTIADDDPLFALAASTQRQRASGDAEDVRSTYTEEQVSEAEAFVFKFISEEGIDSTLRGPGNASSLEDWEKWVAENRHWFVEDMRFEPKQTEENIAWGRLVTPERLILDGWPNENTAAAYNWKQSSPFSYKYGEDIMRVTNRNIVPGEIFVPSSPGLPGFGNLGFKGTVQYALQAEHNGTDTLEADTARYHIVVALNGEGEWKIHSVSMYGSQD